MRFGRSFAQHERVGDLTIRSALGDHASNLALTLGQAAERLFGGAPRGQRRSARDERDRALHEAIAQRGVGDLRREFIDDAARRR